MGRRRLLLRGGRQELALAVARLEAAAFERWLAEGHRIRNRRFALFVALSLAVHALLFAIPRVKPPVEPMAASSMPLDVRLLPGPEIVAEAPPATATTPPRPTPRPRPRAPQVPKVPPPVVAEAPKVAVPPPEPEPAPAPSVPTPPVDMLAMIEARRQQRRAQEGAGRTPPSAQAPKDPALQNLNRNLATLNNRGEGVGGVFQVLRKGVRTGEFAFNGWKPDANRTWREVIEVDAGQGGDVERAMVKRMIELIRSHYSGDFQWESHRLGRVITLSAKPEDQAGLEEFLIREFFGPPGFARSR